MASVTARGEKILQEMLPEQSEKDGRERRIDARHPLGGETQVLLIGPPARLVSAVVRDLSVNGIGLTCERQFAPNEAFVYSFRREGQSVLVLAQVAHCRPARNGKFSIGARFMDARRCGNSHEVVPLSWLGLQVEKQGFGAAPQEPA